MRKKRMLAAVVGCSMALSLLALMVFVGPTFSPVSANPTDDTSQSEDPPPKEIPVRPGDDISNGNGLKVPIYPEYPLEFRVNTEH